MQRFICSPISGEKRKQENNYDQNTNTNNNNNNSNNSPYEKYPHKYQEHYDLLLNPETQDSIYQEFHSRFVSSLISRTFQLYLPCDTEFHIYMIVSRGEITWTIQSDDDNDSSAIPSDTPISSHLQPDASVIKGCWGPFHSHASMPFHRRIIVPSKSFSISPETTVTGASSSSSSAPSNKTIATPTSLPHVPMRPITISVSTNKMLRKVPWHLYVVKPGLDASNVTSDRFQMNDGEEDCLDHDYEDNNGENNNCDDESNDDDEYEFRKQDSKENNRGRKETYIESRSNSNIEVENVKYEYNDNIDYHQNDDDAFLSALSSDSFDLPHE